jgi:hypothetical protein
MNTNSNDDRSKPPQGVQSQPQVTYASSLATTCSYDASQPAQRHAEAPQSLPMTFEEIASIMRLLENFRTQLLWLYCHWAAEARQGQLSSADLADKADPIFQRVRDQFVAHLAEMLDACPTPIVVSPLSADDKQRSAG